MTTAEIRQTFLDFFERKGHDIVRSAPIVNKDDPTLLFTNAGMNQFKDYFLGNQERTIPRVVDTQKCLRVSGKHNDLEEVGRDSYHHTMFEMLGNWSFGDYFKQEAIDWAWELLTEVYKLNKEDLYASYFGGDEAEGLAADEEAANMWRVHLPDDRILPFDKKDNFWEMGAQGPCGPCSEIHIDLRSDEDKAKVPGATLVNQDHPLVIEIWNLVFIQFNRKADGSLEQLAAKHIDTGMGLERLCMALQGKQSNYDTDQFAVLIQDIEKRSGKSYTNDYADDAYTDIAMRVIADHLRAVSFTIADGQLPSNTGAGYVVRRILRRAVRYGFSFLDLKEPFMYDMVSLLVRVMGDAFPELVEQQEFLTNVIREEEKSFLRTLEGGLKRLEQLGSDSKQLSGDVVFELYDTFGFPVDLTRLIAAERGLEIDEDGFKSALDAQRKRSKADAAREVSDWTEMSDSTDVTFVGYDDLNVKDAQILKYRTVKTKSGKQHHLVLDKTPFYPEGGGQVGDTGTLKIGEESISILDTRKENDLIIHVAETIPANPNQQAVAQVNADKRRSTESNHSATHLMHSALREVLGDHVQQRGSLVNDSMLRFDFSHFGKMTQEEIKQVEQLVNQKIRANISLDEKRSIPIDEARDLGATMLFGEKYGDSVRVITFDSDYSMELCGGCHVDATGQIGTFVITSEGGVAAGVRRVEALTGQAAEAYLNEQRAQLSSIKELVKGAADPVSAVSSVIEEVKALRKKLEKATAGQAANLQGDLLKQAEAVGDTKLIISKIPLGDAKAIKTLVFNLRTQIGSGVIVLGAEVKGKPNLTIAVTDDLTDKIQAGALIRELASHIRGGGGGQPHFATAGGSNLDGIQAALDAADASLKSEFA